MVQFIVCMQQHQQKNYSLFKETAYVQKEVKILSGSGYF